jgi:Xaa-Pro aminopeptidase
MSTTIDPHAEVEKARGRAPQPPVEEQVGRLNRTRESMERHGIDVLLLYGSSASPEMTRYLAGYVHVFPGASSLLVIPLEGSPVLLIDQPWHLVEAARMSWIEDVRQYPNPARKWLADELQAAIRQAVQTRGATSPRVGVFAGVMPSIYADVLSASLPDAINVEATPVWEELVGSPSAYDGEMIRATARVADAGFAAAVESAGAGVPEYEVCFASLRAMAALGAEFLHGSGVSTHINIGSFSDAISNVRPFLYSSEPLEQGQMFWLDLSASHAGYYTDSDRTISVGEPNEEQQRIFDATTEIYRVMCSEARAGITGGELWELANRVVEEAGYAEYSNHIYLGHTTGITTSVRPVVAKGETAELRAGSFLNIEPGIFVPGVGSACIEDTLYLTEDGATPINEFGTEVHVV